MSMKRCTLLLLVLACSPLALSQCEPPANLQTFVTLPAETLIEGIGSSDIPVTSQDELAKKLVRQGFALAHCFWNNESIRSFRDAIKRDRQCPIAYLGLNYVLTMPWFRSGNTKEEAEWAMKQAVALVSRGTELEQRLIAAARIRSYGKEERDSDYERAMLKVVKDFPIYAEPRLMVSGPRVMQCLSDGFDDNGNPSGTMKEVVDLLLPILKWDPECAGAHHYLIHAFEPQEPNRALLSADVLGKIAFASSHMVHMPGHIYNRVGDYDSAHRVFSKSRDLDDAYYKTMPGSNDGTNWNYGHNKSFMAINLAEAGRLEEAREVSPKDRWTMAAIAWRAGDWKAAAEKSIFGANENFFRGMQAVAEGDLSTAKQRLWKLIKAKKDGPGRIDGVMTLELSGAILAAEGAIDKAVDDLHKACKAYEKVGYEEPPYYIRPPQETLGWVLLKAGKKNEAREAFREGLRFRPNSYWMKKGLEAVAVQGKTEKGP